MKADDTIIEMYMTLAPVALREANREFEKRYIARMMAINSGRKGKTADMLGVDRKTLYRKLKEYEI